MLDRTGGLFNYYPNFGDISGLALANSSAWLNPVAMATYLDRLYVLDTEAGQIWKYYASNDYAQLAGDEAIFFSAEADLGSAVDFDLFAEDGSLIVVYADGRVRYYDTRSGRVQWDETTLQQRGLTTPLISPTAVKIVGTGLNASIYILDSGSGRLLQLSRGGTVLDQIRVLDEAGNDVLSRASDFAVVESPFRLFVVAGDAIYRAEH
jgi:outer membrane protein assembly factor BamB